jgi:hypothetical protein
MLVPTTQLNVMIASPRPRDADEFVVVERTTTRSSHEMEIQTSPPNYDL